MIDAHGLDKVLEEMAAEFRRSSFTSVEEQRAEYATRLRGMSLLLRVIADPPSRIRIIAAQTIVQNRIGGLRPA